MALEFHPTAKDFKAAPTPQLVYTRIINDMDTPVSAFIKAAMGKPYAFLFESVQGGEQRGRYSFFGFDPDLIWRGFGDESEARPMLLWCVLVLSVFLTKSRKRSSSRRPSILIQSLMKPMPVLKRSYMTSRSRFQHVGSSLKTLPPSLQSLAQQRQSLPIA